MALIGKIRQHGWFLLIIVGIAMGAFVLGDFLKRKPNSTQTEIGEIAGVAIPALMFEQQVQEAIDAYKEQTKKNILDQSTIDMIREQTWSKLLNENIFGKEYKSLGINVHPDELKDMVVGAEPHPSIVQAFSNPETGQFNPGDVINFFKSMDEDQTGATRERWLPFEQAIKSDRKKTKYNNLIKKGLYITAYQAKREYDEKNRKAGFRYILQRYGDIPDSLAVVTEKDVNNYYKEHINNFEQEPSRTLEYIVYNVFPSVDDSLDINEWIIKTKEEMKNVHGIEDITAFVNMNADSRYSERYVSRDSLSENIDSVMFNSDTGFVFGPYMRSEEHTSELQSHSFISYAVFCLKKKKYNKI